ncbi:MAG: metallophosphoesterase [Planctomycetes bacterium]|nr:metallophosphoesterase [Planctomycetota bacterium]
MKRVLGLGLTVVVLVTAVALSKNDRPTSTTGDGELRIDQEARNPWTHLRLNNGRDNFQFALVSDRTGGHRAKVFSQAVDRLNLLQPEFVVSVGDLIEGYTDDKEKLAEQWKEFDGYVRKLQMPFFYVPGNHDLSNATQDKQWEEKFGRRYYHFVYRNVLFLLLSSEERTPKDEKNAGNRDISKLSAKQIDYVKKVLADNRDVRWTVVALHRPMWTINNGEKNGWLDVEKLLEGRRYTVFAGHIHQYRKYVRNGMAYYQLATTGGGSKLRGVRHGEFDHIAWITMKKDGPVLANVMLDGVYPEDMTVPASDELGVPEKNRKKTHLAGGKVVLEGKPVPNATVVLWAYNAKTKRYGRVADGLSESDGSYRLSTYKAFDGAPEGEYTMTAVRHEPQFDETGRRTPNKLPERYAQPETSPLKATVRSGNNTIDLDLSR